MNEEQARERIEDLKGYYAHLASYIGVNLFLFVINFVTYEDTWWFIYPLFGWGIGLIVHTFDVFAAGPDWEARKLQELTGLADTRDALQRLSERTDALVTILSNVNWEAIDPELLDTREQLQAARRRISELEQADDADSRAEVTAQIEKLEAFVTGPKFRYIDLAASGGDAPKA